MRREVVLYIWGVVCCDCCVVLCVGMVYLILRSLFVMTVMCLCASVWFTVYWGIFYCAFGVLLCVGMVYCILRGLGLLIVVCFCASVWFSV